MRQVLRVFPDYTADPVWCSEGMVDLDELSISDRLRRDLREWARDWEDQLGRDFFARGVPEDLTHQRQVKWTATLLDLMRAYAQIRTRDEFRPFVPFEGGRGGGVQIREHRTGLRAEGLSAGGAHRAFRGETGAALVLSGHP